MIKHGVHIVHGPTTTVVFALVLAESAAATAAPHASTNSGLRTFSPPSIRGASSHTAITRLDFVFSIVLHSQ